jgi:hypothetical protein
MLPIVPGSGRMMPLASLSGPVGIHPRSPPQRYNQQRKSDFNDFKEGRGESAGRIAHKGQKGNDHETSLCGHTQRLGLCIAKLWVQFRSCAGFPSRHQLLVLCG